MELPLFPRTAKAPMPMTAWKTLLPRKSADSRRNVRAIYMINYQRHRDDRGSGLLELRGCGLMELRGCGFQVFRGGGGMGVTSATREF